MLKWQFYSKQWFDKIAPSDNQKDTRVVKYIEIGFEAVKAIFAETESLYFLFGIRQDTQTNNRFNIMFATKSD